MAEVIYDGPFPEVSIEPGEGRRAINAERGKAVEVSDDLAKSLLEQSTWRDAKKKVTPKAAEIAAQEGVDLDAVKGSGKGGAVTANDVAEAAEEKE